MTVDQPRALTYLQQANLEGFLAWQNKLRRGYVQVDTLTPDGRFVIDRWFECRRAEARAWLASRRPKRAEVRPIWTARTALNRLKSRA